MRRHTIALSLCLLVPGSLPSQATTDSLRPHCELTSDTECIYKASISQLLAEPQVFDGKRVRVIGYIHVEFESHGLYTRRQDKKLHRYRNSVWVDFKEGVALSRDCQDRYVLVEGTFNARRHGHLGLWRGAITDITHCVPQD
jgi:hypothetical protein